MPMTDKFVAQLDYCLRTELPRGPPHTLHPAPHTDTDTDCIIPLNQVPHAPALSIKSTKECQ
eukprot:scaffold37663_cov132-Skeletonema_marinoi.AAC.6